MKVMVYKVEVLMNPESIDTSTLLAAIRAVQGVVEAEIVGSGMRKAKS